MSSVYKFKLKVTKYYFFLVKFLSIWFVAILNYNNSSIRAAFSTACLKKDPRNIEPSVRRVHKIKIELVYLK